jgi:hypothetical protein
MNRRSATRVTFCSVQVSRRLPFAAGPFDDRACDLPFVGEADEPMQPSDRRHTGKSRLAGQASERDHAPQGERRSAAARERGLFTTHQSTLRVLLSKLHVDRDLWIPFIRRAERIVIASSPRIWLALCSLAHRGAV